MGPSRSNLVQSTQLVLDALPFLKITLPQRLDQDAAAIRNVQVNDLQVIEEPVQKALMNLWDCKDFKEAVSYGQTYQLNDSATCK